jgi:hypothetical protein
MTPPLRFFSLPLRDLEKTRPKCFHRGEKEKGESNRNLFFKIESKMTMDFARGFLYRRRELIFANGALKRIPGN